MVLLSKLRLLGRVWHGYHDFIRVILRCIVRKYRLLAGVRTRIVFGQLKIILLGQCWHLRFELEAFGRELLIQIIRGIVQCRWMLIDLALDYLLMPRIWSLVPVGRVLVVRALLRRLFRTQRGMYLIDLYLVLLCGAHALEQSIVLHLIRIKCCELMAIN